MYQWQDAFQMTIKVPADQPLSHSNSNGLQNMYSKLQ